MQASNFIRKKLEAELQVPGRNNKPVRLSNSSNNTDSEIKNFKMALKLGGVVIMENFLEPINPLIKPLILNKTFKKGNATMVMLDEEEIEVNKDFNIYLINPNPRPV
jgi:hypothetical protein